MKSSLLISIVIPTYNREHLISRAVRSVIDQRYRDFELHLVDDGSQDGTKKVLAPFFSDPRFHYHYQSNHGQSAARNKGIAASSGTYIAFLDSDNYWLPDKLDRQISFMDDHSGYDVYYGNIYVTGPDGQLNLSRRRRYSGRVLDKLIAGNFITNNTVLIKRRCFDEAGCFDEQLRHAEDYDLWLRFAVHYNYMYQPEPLACYCTEGERVSSDQKAVVEANFQILKRFFKTYPKAVSNEHQKAAWSRLYRWRALVAHRNGWGSPWRDVLRATAHAPFVSRNWKAIARIALSPSVSR